MRFGSGSKVGVIELLFHELKGAGLPVYRVDARHASALSLKVNKTDATTSRLAQIMRVGWTRGDVKGSTAAVRALLVGACPDRVANPR